MHYKDRFLNLMCNPNSADIKDTGRIDTVNPPEFFSNLIITFNLSI